MSKRLMVVSLLMLLASACSSQVTVLTPQTGEEIQSTQPAPSNPPIATATSLIPPTDMGPLPTFAFDNTPVGGGVSGGSGSTCLDRAAGYSGHR